MDISLIEGDGFEVWVPFMDARVLLRYVGLEDLRRIHASAQQSTWDRKGEPVHEMDHAEAGRLLGRTAVRGWEGFTREGGDFPFSPEHCDLLMTRWSEFSRFVAESAMDLVKLEEARLAESEKKSALTSGQGGTTRG